jgi:hypothetical protein
MKTKILNALKTEYAKMGLGDKAFDGVASFLVKTITKEEDIDGVIKSEDTRNLLKAFQGESDSLRNRAAQLQKDLDAYKQSHPDKDPDEGKKDPPEEGKGNKDLLDKLEALTRRLDERDAKDREAATIASVKASVRESCPDERALKLTEKLFSVKDGESNEDAAKRFKDEYDANVKEYFGGGIAPYRGERMTKPVEVSSADKAAQAREDAKRVREG